MTAEMHAQPGDRSCTNQAIAGNRFGPVIVNMSQAIDTIADSGSALWLKVDEEGCNPTTK